MTALNSSSKVALMKYPFFIFAMGVYFIAQSIEFDRKRHIKKINMISDKYQQFLSGSLNVDKLLNEEFRIKFYDSAMVWCKWLSFLSFGIGLGVSKIVLWYSV